MRNNYDYRKTQDATMSRGAKHIHPRRAGAVALETQRTRRATNDVSYLEKVQATVYGV